MAKNEKNQTRRDFLKTAGIAGAAAAVSTILPGCAGTSTTGTTGGGNAPANWDYTSDVVVVGIGFAGLSSAISAFDAGASVNIIEKAAAAYEGGNSRVCGQCWIQPENVSDGKKYFLAMANGHESDFTDAFVTTWATEMMNNATWMAAQLGKTPTTFPIFNPELPGLAGGTSIQCYIVGGAGNSILWKPLRAVAATKGIPVYNQKQAATLYTNGDGVVVGVGATDLVTLKTVNFKANKGVILCSGGFEFNQSLKQNNLQAPCFGMGSPYNTGDGLTMARPLGADYWHMNQCLGPIWFGYYNPKVDPSWPNNLYQLNVSNADSVFIDAHGKRFVNEAKNDLHGKGFNEFFYFEANSVTEFYGYPRVPAWLVFGSAAAANPIVPGGTMGWTNLLGTYTWSKDNSTEVTNGWVLKANDLPTLAAAMATQNLTTYPIAAPDPNMAANMEAAINQYNTDAALTTPVDSVYGRTGIKALTAPFYAIQMSPGMVNTQGGPKRNEKAQIVDVNGTPIPHLFSSGELGSAYAWLYNGGGNVGECLAWGRIAAQNAVANAAV
jgi:succinate dehydrogenase/fumarate reductase flavoprotein subunit